MDGSIKPEGPVEGGESAKLDLLIRAGRGRTGGSTGLDLAVQRARHQGRRGQAAGRRSAEQDAQQSVPSQG